jgi:hypothetical protein
MQVVNWAAGVFKTCEGFQLEELTKIGWHIVAMIQEDSGQSYNKTESVSLYPKDGYCAPESIDVEIPAIDRKVLFLLRLDPEGELARKQKKLEEAEAAKAEAEQLAVDACKEKNASEHALNISNDNLDRRTRQVTDQTKQIQTERDRSNKMEEDISKLRDAIGGDRMKEIIGRDADEARSD